MPKESDRSSALATQPDTAPARNAPPAISTMMPMPNNRLNLENQSAPQALCFFRLRTQMPIATPCTRRVGNHRAAGIGGAQVGRRARRRAFGGGDPGAAPPTSPPPLSAPPRPAAITTASSSPALPPSSSSPSAPGAEGRRRATTPFQLAARRRARLHGGCCSRCSPGPRKAGCLN